VALAFWQTALGAVALLLLGRRPRLDAAHLKFYAVSGLLGSALPSWLVAMAAQSLSAGVMAVAMAMAPLLCLGLVTAIGIERFSLRRVGGLALGLGAVVLIAGPLGGAGVPLGALLMAIGAACSYATEDVYIAIGRPPASGPFTLLSGMLVAASVYLVPGWLLAGGGLPLPLSVAAATGWAALGIMALGNLLAYGGFVALIGRVGPLFASQVSYVIVAAGVLWGMAVLGEQHATGFWLALALMLAGLTLARPARENTAD
jgi:drug/metabolite transporter (DMT)-like permease